MTADERGPFALRYVPGTDLALVTTCAYEVSVRTWDDPAVYCERDAEPGSRYCAIHGEEM